ncbi:hypothetical protein COT42_00835 [Candidatus Saganbacteria bacterium CG08_land_8_20_14_0_20_45_16]|uniref:Response regulatory domain-containing protein n=1 Tax=Candidatus Saganbacteria bacterium CG08_land_8_20_14_0_20_45_16 TaxID=2014293 RepID=A0A2H0Y3S1_UNCSA|nr:MAG: hypothetical protein COT42_00835 [Candidatus Saganbacteria bacterium CG08_land_8_20_14_0_20_45_16]
MNKKVKVLVVDDELSVLESFKMILEIKDYEVRTALGMDEAVQAVKEENFDLAFVDLRFKGQDIGLGILAEIKKIKPKTKVVICTAFASDESKNNAVQLGAMDYISKPFMMEAIYKLVERALSKS